MHINSITLNGFKSFAEETTLKFSNQNDLDRNSITAVVGPNGSGKSNISDAIRWVMGEQSLSKLRAKTNEDLIFNGSETKRRKGRASVTLRLDNSDRKVDMDYDEIVLNRKFYRSGDSEYQINGEEVRLLDIQMMLAEAQFASSSYSIIGQGVVDQLVTQSPKDRKEFFDEAVGIKKYQIKRRQAWLKLNRTQENLKEVETLLNELRPKKEGLEKKVEKLNEKKELQLELQELQEKYYTTVWNRYENEIRSLKEKITKIKQKLKDKKTKLDQTKSKLADLAQQKDRQSNFDQLQEKHQKLTKEKNKLQEEKSMLEGKLKSQYSQSGQENINWLKEKLENLQEQKQEQSEHKQNIAKKVEQKEEKLVELKKEINKIKQKQENQKNKLKKLTSKVQQAQSEEKLSKYIGIKAIRSILKNKEKFDGVYGTVAQLGEVSDKFRLALDIAAGGHLSSLVVEDDKVAQECVEFLREYKLGYATFLPLNEISPRYTPNDINQILSHPQAYDIGKDLINFDSKFATIFSYALGSTVVVENMDSAREIGVGRVRMVTLKGDLLETSGSIKGGHRSKNRKISFSAPAVNSSINLEEKKQEIKQLKQQLKQTEDRLEEKTEQESKLNQQQDKLKNKLDLAKEQKKELTEQIRDIRQKLKLAKEGVSEDEQLEEIKQRQEKIDRKISNKEKKINNIEQKIEEFNQKEEQKKKQVFQLQEKMQTKQKEIDKLKEQKKEHELKLTKFETKQEDLTQEVQEEMNTTIKELLQKGADQIDWSKKEDIYDRIKKINYKLSLIGQIDPEVKEKYQEIKNRYDELQAQLGDLAEAMEDSKSLIKELDKTMKQERKEGFKQIKQKFKEYFKILFGGGSADLEKNYEESDTELLDHKQKKLTGVDIIASPPGKKINNIRVLSGGERSLVAIALICAIIKTNPSPTIVLDEVEAALDEANSKRFVQILKQLAENSQFILVTHNRTTMHAADSLYGVTIGSDGTSDVVSLNLEQAEEMSE
jgi:chromosome segregation protein